MQKNSSLSSCQLKVIVNLSFNKRNKMKILMIFKIFVGKPMSFLETGRTKVNLKYSDKRNEIRRVDENTLMNEMVYGIP